MYSFLKKEFDTYRPAGFHTINAYIFSENPEILIDFLKNAFLADELNRNVDKQSGVILNSILQIGDSCFMISQARGEFLKMRSSFYLFVANVDETYQNALKFGGISNMEPADMEYDDRQAGIQDPSGNYWWISKRLIEENYID